jgi:SAM-dependent methyltransferase
MKEILDPCCGAKMFWLNKSRTDTVYMDIRNDVFYVKDKSSKGGTRKISIAPDVIGDVTRIPFPEESFSLIIFDPPHLLHPGKTGWMAKKYGILPADWKTFIKASFDECFRVLKPSGTLVFKWSEKDIRAKDVLSVIGYTPVVGSRSRTRDTKWFIFFKPRSSSDVI